MARHGAFQRVTARVTQEFIKDTIVQTLNLCDWLDFHASDVVQKLDHVRRKLPEQVVASANERFKTHLVQLAYQQEDVELASDVFFFAYV